MLGNKNFSKRIESATTIFKTVCRDLDKISDDIEKSQQIEAKKIVDAQKSIDDSNKELSKVNNLRVNINKLLGVDESSTDNEDSRDSK